MKNVQTLKGFRDFLPQEARKRQYVINALKEVFELYGFEPLETPALEYAEILLGKYGEEGDKLMYKFKDNGDRDVALRYDQTVPTARVVAQYQNDLPMPFKRYQIQPVWRAENTQKGRYREFLQCDGDIIGTSSPLAETEMISMVFEMYQKLGLDVIIKVNDRNLLKEFNTKSLSTLDKLNKIGEEGVLKELAEKGFSTQEATELLEQAKAIKASTQLKQIIEDFLKKGYPTDSIMFDGTLIRGLDYYTGLIFEVVLKKNPQSSSLCGGGRYDNLIGMFAQKQIPAVGFAIGFDRTLEAMEEFKLFPDELTTTQILVTVFSPELKEKSAEVTARLREQNINTEMYLETDAKMDKQLKYADKKGIPYAIVIGPEESENNVLTLKNMKTREQKQVTLEQLPNEINQ